MALGRIVIASVAVAVIAVLIAGIATEHGGRSYEPEDVASALNAQGLAVTPSDLIPLFGAKNTAILLPVDGNFTVAVLDSDRSARDAFVPYEADADPDTFELRAGNVIILADGSNSETPLPSETRRRIRRAIVGLTSDQGGRRLGRSSSLARSPT